MLSPPLEVSMRRPAVACSLITVAVGLLAGCPDRSIDEVLPQQGRVEAKDIPINVNRDLDLLFLIDDSPSMKDKQNNLADNFPNFIKVISQIPGGLPNVHIGIVTSDMGTRDITGRNADAVPPLMAGGCNATGGNKGDMKTFMAPVTGDPFISDVAPDMTMPNNRMRNYSGSLEDVFSTMAKSVGATGCGFEQHLAAIQAALQPGHPVNQRFLRPSAYLGIIIIADEDDCSMSDSPSLLAPGTDLGDRQSFRCTRYGVTCDQGGQNSNAMNNLGAKSQCHPNDDSPYLAKVSDFVKFVKGLKDDPRKVIVAGIMGTSNRFEVEMRSPSAGKPKIPALAHSCTYVGGDINGDGLPDPEVADPPIRLQFFLDQFPNRSTFATICQKNLSGGLQQIGELLKTVIGDPCIEGKLADVDPNTGGAQYECSVSRVTGDEEKIVPACPGPLPTDPCWRIATDAASCPNSDHLVLKIDNQDRIMEQDSHILANCVTEVTTKL